MGLIALSDDQVWKKAGWVVSRVLSDALRVCADDAELRSLVENSLAWGGISLDLLDRAVAARLVEVLKTVVAVTISESGAFGLAWRNGLDAISQLHYKEAIKELGELISPPGN